MNSFGGLFNYGASVFLLMFGLYVVIAERNLIRKVIGVTFVQTSVILFFITLSYKKGSVLPILPVSDVHSAAVNPDLYANPLPHALMLTAIVVGVSTLGVALTLVVSIYRSYQTIEEDEVLKKMKHD